MIIFQQDQNYIKEHANYETGVCYESQFNFYIKHDTTLLNVVSTLDLYSKTEIDNSNPFVIWLQGQNGSMSHVIVASGYKTGSTNYIYILDPSPNIDEQYFSYTGLVNGTTGTLETRCYERTVLRK